MPGVRVDRISPWFLALRPAQPARVRLFCFPYAGGGASIYRRWTALPEAGVELWATQLPGHEDRYSEPAFARLTDLIPPLATEIAPHLSTTPFAFFGHSMGALIAFELARELRRRGLPSPVQLFVSGRRAPHLPERAPVRHTMPEAELKAHLRSLNGTPAAVLDNEELMELMLPVLRADFAICDTYVCEAGEPLAVPIASFGGSQDAEAMPDDMTGWARHSAAPGRARTFPGGHFFLHDAADALAHAVAEDLTGVPSLT